MNNQTLRRLEITRAHVFPNAKPVIAQNHNNRSHGGLDLEDTCGIIAFVGKKGDSACPYLMEGLEILQNRGYDSAGICTIAQDQPSNELVISKYASVGTTSDAIQRLSKSLSRHEGHHIGIAHTRWATHGAKTDVNAHPHTDYKNRIALVHNGVIENASELRKELLSKHGIKCVSETDTEVIAQLIGKLLDDGLALVDAVKEAAKLLEGTWGLAIVSKDNPDELIAVRNGSPLLIGLAKDRMFVASEASAFSRHTRDFVCLENGEVAVLRADSGSVDKVTWLNRIEKAETEVVQLSPDPYPHWTIKEIEEQPASISRALNYGGRFSNDANVKLGGLEANRDWLGKIQNLVIAACGTSYHAGMYGAKLMRNLRCFDSVTVIDAAELTPEDFPKNNSGLLVISQSGETKDVMRCLNIAEDLDLPSFSVVNAVGSQIARTTKCGVYTNSGREHAVASTKAFTAQVTVLSLISIWFAQIKGQEIKKRQDIIESLHRLPTSVGMALNVRPQCKELATKLVNQRSIFILGRGLGEPIAKEGALKIKEITYIHAEGFPMGSLKHGPFALIEKGTPIIIIMLNDAHKAHARTAAEEVKSRGAFVIGVTDNLKEAKEVCDFVLPVPSNGIFSALLATIPLQLLAYELAILKKIDPDKPRNLAKAVTVF